jgi:hypothetical protein
MIYFTALVIMLCGEPQIEIKSSYTMKGDKYIVTNIPFVIPEYRRQDVLFRIQQHKINGYEIMPGCRRA